MKKIHEVQNFGAVDAESDDILKECFANHEAYLQSKSFEKFLVIGRKGGGKTAIFRELLGRRESNTFTLGHTFTDYPWHHHIKQTETGIPEHERYIHSWKYLIFITLSKILLNFDNSQPFDEPS